MREQKSGRTLSPLLMCVLLSSLLLRGEALGAGRGEDGTAVENSWKPQMKVMGSQTSRAFWELLFKGALLPPWLWYRTVLYSCILGQLLSVCSCCPDHWCVELPGVLDVSTRALW